MALIQSGTALAKAECHRCGTCCIKGGPALHRQDSDLLRSRVLLVSDLCTFRSGELVRNIPEMSPENPENAVPALAPLPQELVKIAPVKASSSHAHVGRWACRFLMNPTSADKPQYTCAIHKQQPIECKAFFCEAPAELLALGGESRLNRADVLTLLESPAWWLELGQSHEEACSYAELTSLAPELNTKAEARARFLEIVAYDQAFRELMVEKKAAPQEALPFLLGRPLVETVIMFGLRVHEGPNGLILSPEPNAVVLPEK